MWMCPKCRRIFKNTNQSHTCKKVTLKKHFERKEQAKELFDFLVKQINSKIGKCKIISIPCCIHLFGKYNFLAALPKKDKLEIRFALNRKIKSPRLKEGASLSSRYYKNCLNIFEKKEINKELLEWLKESYHLKDLG